MSRDLEHLKDIFEAARLVQSFIKGVDKRSFVQDRMRQAAVIRELEIIGEATKRLSETFRDEYPKIPWREMAGMRDILIHAYDHVDPEEIWTAAREDVAHLIEHIAPLIDPDDTPQDDPKPVG